MDIKAIQKFTVESPKKLREVAYVLRSSKIKPVYALVRLEMMRKRSADTIRKVVNTAVANAKALNLNPEELVFKEIQVNEGPVLKRYRAGSRGRAKPYKKRMSHIRVVLSVVKKKAESKVEDKPVNEKRKLRKKK